MSTVPDPKPVAPNASPVTPASKPGKASPTGKGHDHKNDLLDEALEESFPASDPVAVSITKEKR